ncbi:MAG TPA: lipid II flippase MurJ [Ramlibacter sp.]|jgi:putative peptidoglycan lipid II flippase|uniref:lipid II flippase MurJ n=1 Tax=Ramlibacter sp. TaxID=1917967 RepID=UPI002D712241|nr:lipid II flippase MurJ [Ramlibacter sp.]HZY18411.1 lipid II flippase MurJ [Ramlibacter sp.]
MSARLGLTLGAITAANMLAWFLLQGYVLATTGAGVQADAFFASLAVPQLVLLVANSSFAHVLIPFFSGKARAQVQGEAMALVLVVGGSFAAVAGLLWLAAPAWVPLVVPGFDAAARTLAVSLARVQVVGMAFSAVSAVLLAACHAQGRFALAESAPLLGTLAAFAAMVVVLPTHGVAGAAWVNVARALVGMLVLAPLLVGAARAPWGAAAGVWARLRPLLLSATYYKSDQLFDRFFTSMGQAGALSLFYFAQQAALAVNSVLGKAISAPAVPRLAVLVRQGDWPQFHRLYRRRLLLLTGASLLCCLAAGAGLALGWPFGGIGQLKLLRGQDLAGALGLFMLMSGVIVGGGAGLILSEAFFTLGDTRTPSLVTAGCFTVGIGMKAAGFSLFGVEGLALATSAYFLSYPAALFLLLEATLARKRTLADAG